MEGYFRNSCHCFAGIRPELQRKPTSLPNVITEFHGYRNRAMLRAGHWFDSRLGRLIFLFSVSVSLTTRDPLSAKFGTSPTSCGRSVGIVRSQSKATEFVFT
jgi:hypothetical protein